MPRQPLATPLLAACSLRPYDFTASATGTTADGSTTTPPDPTTGAPPTTGTLGTTTTTATTDATTGADGSTTQIFITPQDAPNTKQCDQWIENCPEGQKCMPYSGDGDNAWESLKCSPIVRDPDGLGEPCMVFGGGVSGEDTCDKHMMCWNIDPDTKLGACIAMCSGSIDAPSCEPPKTFCHIAADAVLTLCLPGCDPLVQDCQGSDLCLPYPNDPETFICVIDASGDEGQPFDLCEYANACDPGLVCADPALAVECDQSAPGCCLPFCDLKLPNNCPGAGQECVPWFEPGQAPPGCESLGSCALPD